MFPALFIKNKVSGGTNTVVYPPPILDSIIVGKRQSVS